MDAFRLLTANPEANEAMKLLQDDELDWDMWGLTIGDFGEALHHLGKAKLGRYTGEHFVCCDELHVAKPHPKVYSELMRMAVHNKQKIEVTKGYIVIQWIYLC
jgi:FMN phosphatase YigB (HAD superfamily)